MRWPASRGGERGQAATELGRLLTRDGEIEVGQLVRALSRAVVHVPMPQAPTEPVPRPATAEDGDVPLFVMQDDDGRHALVYSSPRALVDAWRSRGQTTAAAVALPTLLARWPADTDLVIDAGLPQARVVSPEILREVALDAAGVPTPLALVPSPNGWDTEVPDPEPAQVIGATRAAAEGMPALLGLWRAITRDREPLSREVLTVVARIQPGTDRDEVQRIMTVLAQAIGEVDPRPVRLAADTGEDSNHDELIRSVVGLDAPYWTRGPG